MNEGGFIAARLCSASPPISPPPAPHGLKTRAGSTDLSDVIDGIHII